MRYSIARRNRDRTDFRLSDHHPGIDRQPVAGGFAPLAIGLALTSIHLISIPVTNTSVNPARSTGPASLVGGLALQQFWLFWVAPIIGGVLGGLVYRTLAGEPPAPAITGEPI